MIEQSLSHESSANSTSTSLVASTCSAIGATTTDLREAVLQMLTKANEEMGQRSGQAKMVHDYAVQLEDHMQNIPEQSWHYFQIECLNCVQSYRQGNEQPTTQHQPILQWEQLCQPIQHQPWPPQHQPWQPPQLQFWNNPQQQQSWQTSDVAASSQLKSSILHRRWHRKFSSQELLMFVGLQ